MEKSLSMHPFLKLILPPLGRVGVGISLFEHPFLKLALPPLGRAGVGVSPSPLGRDGVAFRASLLDLLYHSIGIVEAKFTCLAKVFEPFGLLL